MVPPLPTAPVDSKSSGGSGGSGGGLAVSQKNKSIVAAVTDSGEATPSAPMSFNNSLIFELD